MMYFYSLALLVGTALASPCAPPHSASWIDPASSTQLKLTDSWTDSGPSTSVSNPGHYGPGPTQTASYGSAGQGYISAPGQGNISFGGFDYPTAPFSYSLRRTTTSWQVYPHSTSAVSSGWGASSAAGSTWNSGATYKTSGTATTYITKSTILSTTLGYTHSSSSVSSGTSSSYGTTFSTSKSTGSSTTAIGTTHSSTTSSTTTQSSTTSTSSTSTISTLTSSTSTSGTSTSSTSKSSTISSTSSSSTFSSISTTTTTNRTTSTTVSSTTSTATLLNYNSGLLFLLDITIEGQNFEVDIDTGSSDTYISAADLTTRNTFVQIPNENFDLTYVDGTHAEGILGTDTVTLAGVTVTSQIIGLADANSNSFTRAANQAGLIGLSYPDLTSAYSGTTPGSGNKLPAYSSIMNTIFNVDKLTSPLFSLALNRDAATTEDFGGILAIGGLPDITSPTVNVTSTIANTPMVSPNVDYSIAVGSVQYGAVAGLDANAVFLVDSGTTLINVPDASAAAFNALYNPPATLNSAGTYVVPCTATPPALVFTIGGQAFTINPVDLVQQDPVDGATTCATGVQSSGTGNNVLGDVFLKNVLAVFDWGNEVISFGAREYYAAS